MWKSLFVFIIIVFVITLAGLPATSFSDNNTRYVSDFLIINLKSSIDKPYTVVSQLQSNDKLEILEIDGKFARVRTEDNKEGWIQTQYLTSKMPKINIIKRLENEIESLKKQSFTMSDASSETSKSDKEIQKINDMLQQNINELIAENKSLQQMVNRMNSTDKPIEMSIKNENVTPDINERINQLISENDFFQKTNEELMIKNQKLERSLQKLSEERSSGPADVQVNALLSKNQLLEQTVSKLENDRMLYWFIAGAVVFFIGMLAGKLFWKKNRRYGY